MFYVKCKKLEGQDLVNAVVKLQDSKSSRKEKNDAFSDLRDTFGGLIGKKFKSVVELASNKDEREEIRHHIESSFLEVLMDLKPKSPGEIVGYISHAFNTKINRHSISDLLGKGEIVSDISKYKIRFKNALRTFHQKYHRMPDFNKIDLEDVEEESSDLKNFAEIMHAKEDLVLEVLKLFGQGTIKSMYQEVARDEGENALILMDTLKSDEPLPDEVLKDKELVRTMKQAINDLTPSDFGKDSGRVKNDMDKVKETLLTYYRVGQPEAEELKSDQVAEIIFKKYYKGKSDTTLDQVKRKVRDWIAIGRYALANNKKLHELYTASLTNKLVKFAMSKYRTSEDVVFEVVAECQK
jgi:hypothetical protein